MVEGSSSFRALPLLSVFGTASSVSSMRTEPASSGLIPVAGGDMRPSFLRAPYNESRGPGESSRPMRSLGQMLPLSLADDAATAEGAN